MRRAEPPRLPGASPLSIHAPLAGCDHPGPAIVNSFSEFQSTHPLRGATSVILIISRLLQISIHAPLAGCDNAFLSGFYTPCISIHAPLAGCDKHSGAISRRFPISIHAPLAGCDHCAVPDLPRANDFNPRTPCGVRPTSSSTIIPARRFQSTHPLRGATIRVPASLADA